MVTVALLSDWRLLLELSVSISVTKNWKLSDPDSEFVLGYSASGVYLKVPSFKFSTSPCNVAGSGRIVNTPSWFSISE